MEFPMKTKNDDNFGAIHDLIKSRKLSQALELLQHNGNSHIRKEYAQDKNHAWYCIGDIHYKRKDYHSAREAFRKAFKSNPHDAESLLAIANCHDALNNPALAEKSLRIALQIRSKQKINAAIRLNLSNALIDLNKNEEAIEILKTLRARTDQIGRSARANIALIKNRLERKTS